MRTSAPRGLFSFWSLSPSGGEGRVRGSGARAYSRLQVLAVSDLLDHLADAAVGVDLMEDVLGGHEPRVMPLAGRVHLLLEGAPRDLRDLGTAHPAHGRQDGTVIDVGEQ